MGHRLGVPILLSGGTNGLSRQLAELSGVRCNGIAIGTYARNLVEHIIHDSNFYTDESIIKEAYTIAKKLVDNSKMTKKL